MLVLVHCLSVRRHMIKQRNKASEQMWKQF